MIKNSLFVIIIFLSVVSCQSTSENETVDVVETIEFDTTQHEFNHECFGEYEFHMPSTDSLNVDSVILKIKENFKRINSIDKWTDIEVIEIWDESTEGGEMKLYFNGDRLEKFSVKLFGEMGQDLTEYYMRDRRLDFVFKKETKYNTHFIDEEFDFKKSKINKIRTYFYKTEVIKQIFDKKSNHTIFSQMIILDYDLYISMINNTSKIIKQPIKINKPDIEIVN